MSIIDLKNLDSKLSQVLEYQKKAQEAGIPKQETKALSEAMAKPKEYADYKKNVALAMKDISQGQSRADEFLSATIQYTEAIGTVDGIAAVPTIWAKDVMRCCPYPASAFLNAPFIKWHDDIKGKLIEVLIYN